MSAFHSVVIEMLSSIHDCLIACKAERKDKNNQKDQVCMFQNKARLTVLFMHGLHSKGTIYFFSVCSVKAPDGQSVVTLECPALAVLPQACVTTAGALLAINKRSLAVKETSLCSPLSLLCLLDWNLISIDHCLDDCSCFSIRKTQLFGGFIAVLFPNLPCRAPRRLNKTTAW